MPLLNETIKNNKSFLSDEGLRTSTRSVVTNIFGCNDVAQDRKKLIEALEKTANQERQKRKEVEQHLMHLKERNVSREKQFYKILEKLDSNLKKQDEANAQIQEYYNRILETFHDFNEKARDLLQHRYSELYKLMERRMVILMKKMDKQLGKYRKMSEEELKQMREEIKTMADISAQVQSENISLREKMDKLTLNHQMLQEEKKLLLEEIAQKKYQLVREMRKNKKEETVSNTNSEEALTQQNLNQNKLIDSVNFEKGLGVVSKAQSPSKLKTPIFMHKKSQSISIDPQFATICSPGQGKKRFEESTTDKIISHLKASLQRERQKNHKQLKFTLDLQLKQKKVSDFICQKQKFIEKVKNQRSKEQKSNKNLSASNKSAQYQEEILSDPIEVLSRFVQDLKRVIRSYNVEDNTLLSIKVNPQKSCTPNPEVDLQSGSRSFVLQRRKREQGSKNVVRSSVQSARLSSRYTAQKASNSKNFARKGRKFRLGQNYATLKLVDLSHSINF